MAVTPNYGWTIPTVGGDNSTWGTILNTALGDVDTDLKAVSDAAVATQTELTTLKGAMVGQVGYFLASSAPTGWIKANGGTIGNASSGGTTRANADTSALFALYWACDATTFPVYDSGGGASTRGASAAIDYAANKRILIEDLRGEFLRGLDDSRGIDTSRVLGSSQAGQMPAHTHSTSGGNSGSGGAYVTVQSNTASPGIATSSAGGTDNSSENRPRNVARLACIKL